MSQLDQSVVALRNRNGNGPFPAGPRENDERFRLLVESITDYSIILLDPQGRIASWNAGAERIKGYRADEIIGQHISCFHTAEDLRSGKPEQELNAAIHSGRSEDEGWRVRKDGSRFWANVIITALRDSAGTLLGFSNITRDLSAQKQMEEALAPARSASGPSANRLTKPSSRPTRRGRSHSGIRERKPASVMRGKKSSVGR